MIEEPDPVRTLLSSVATERWRQIQMIRSSASTLVHVLARTRFELNALRSSSQNAAHLLVFRENFLLPRISLRCCPSTPFWGLPP